MEDTRPNVKKISELAHHGEMWTGAAFFGSSKVYVNSDQTPFGRYSNWKNGE